MVEQQQTGTKATETVSEKQETFRITAIAMTTLSFLSLPNDVLLRLFSYLASPPVNDELLLSPPGSLPLLLNNPGSPADSLGKTCCRLHVLYHRAVRLVDVRHAPCVCGAPPTLTSFPSADAVVLDERHVALTACMDVRSLTRLRVLGVRCFPSEAYAEELATAVPNLRELLLGFGNHRTSGLYDFVDVNLLRESQRGMSGFILRLPPALKRLSLLGGFGWLRLDGFWDSVSRLQELEELNVSLDFVVSPTDSVAAIRRCRRMRRLSVTLHGNPRDGGISNSLRINDLIPVLPPLLEHFLVLDNTVEWGVADFFREDTQQRHSEDATHEGL